MTISCGRASRTRIRGGIRPSFQLHQFHHAQIDAVGVKLDDRLKMP